MGAIANPNCLQPGRGQARPRREERDKRLARPERGDQRFDVVEVGHDQGGLAERVSVVGGGVGPQRVLDAVAELARTGDGASVAVCVTN